MLCLPQSPCRPPPRGLTCDTSGDAQRGAGHVVADLEQGAIALRATLHRTTPEDTPARNDPRRASAREASGHTHIGGGRTMTVEEVLWASPGGLLSLARTAAPATYDKASVAQTVLPQLINGARGHMSLVGPRPAVPARVAQYDSTVRRGLAVKPGITGRWQVSGWSNLHWVRAVRLDRHYVENRRRRSMSRSSLRPPSRSQEALVPTDPSFTPRNGSNE